MLGKWLVFLPDPMWTRWQRDFSPTYEAVTEVEEWGRSVTVNGPSDADAPVVPGHWLIVAELEMSKVFYRATEDGNDVRVTVFRITPRNWIPDD